MKYFRGGGLSALWEEIKEYLKNYVTIEGNAATATKLKDSVNLWGNPFDGSQPLDGDIDCRDIDARDVLARSIKTHDNNGNVKAAIDGNGDVDCYDIDAQNVTADSFNSRGDVGVTGEIYKSGGSLKLQESVNKDVRMCYGGGTVHCGNNIVATAYDTPSDSRKKIARGDIALSLEDIANAPSILFNWKNDPDGKVRGGTIAQYWQKVAPWAVSEDKDGYLEMDYSALALAASIENAKQIKALRHELGLE